MRNWDFCTCKSICLNPLFLGLYDLHLSKNYRLLSRNGNQYGGLTQIQEKSGREDYLKILSVSGITEVVPIPDEYL